MTVRRSERTYHEVRARGTPERQTAVCRAAALSCLRGRSDDLRRRRRRHHGNRTSSYSAPIGRQAKVRGGEGQAKRNLSPSQMIPIRWVLPPIRHPPFQVLEARGSSHAPNPTPQPPSPSPSLLSPRRQEPPPANPRSAQQTRRRGSGTSCAAAIPQLLRTATSQPTAAVATFPPTPPVASPFGFSSSSWWAPNRAA